ncbi:hypothetical protein B566_EDAN012639 [Ephemera danica]|nr:hypothetical protein B566_EDAN012639 [Ephemera danica]
MSDTMVVDFYYVPGSAPCRAAMLTARAVGVELNLKYVDLKNGEQLKPEFIASRAICCYFANQYGKDDSLYPKDPKKRGLVDARMYFDYGTLFQRFMDYYYPVMFAGALYDATKLKRLEEAYQLFDKLLEGETWVAGKTMTIADLTTASTVATAEVVGFDVSRYSNVSRWLAHAKTTIPGYDEINQRGVDMFKEMFDHLTHK